MSVFEIIFPQNYRLDEFAKNRNPFLLLFGRYHVVGNINPVPAGESLWTKNTRIDNRLG